VATVEQCEAALQALAERSARKDGSKRLDVDRTLSCTITDLGVTYGGRLTGGRLTDIAVADGAGAQVRLTLRSDDLVALVDGELGVASAWATGRLKIDAGMRDLIRLRSIF
jgi:hypothetical protein